MILLICNIVSGSPKNNLDIIKSSDADFYIGVDYGAYLLSKNHLQLDLAVGDFDSVGTHQFLEILNHSKKVIKYDKIKSQTDTEIAILEAIQLGTTEIRLFGVTGRRLDHFLGTLNVFHFTLEKDIHLSIIDKYNQIYVLKPGKHEVNKGHYQYISFFSFKEEVKNLTLTGFKYPLEGYHLDNQDTKCISNEIEETTATIQFDEGLLLVVESND